MGINRSNIVKKSGNNKANRCKNITKNQKRRNKIQLEKFNQQHNGNNNELIKDIISSTNISSANQKKKKVLLNGKQLIQDIAKDKKYNKEKLEKKSKANDDLAKQLDLISGFSL
ncbi:Adf1p SCDLUD_003810 [Saccharomycodes ludwigii]|uniref:Adf1p n=1 Tax=Saccharomycodes ludwigii TaxID=36035 RepID=UPI001E82B207|nr:hypothetical protein SCDLUD_003810 [Saccharomycodes ludwigii]KAH3899533.1 hypothetical protein SCDLUD_003810 [Saccharomycodes ludwigii]